MAKKKASTQTKPFKELSKLYTRYGEFFDNAVILIIRGFLFVLSVIVILSVLLATGLLVF